MRSRAVSLPFVCWAVDALLAAAEAGGGALFVELPNDVVHRSVYSSESGIGSSQISADDGRRRSAVVLPSSTACASSGRAAWTAGCSRKRWRRPESISCHIQASAWCRRFAANSPDSPSGCAGNARSASRIRRCRRWRARCRSAPVAASWASWRAAWSAPCASARGEFRRSGVDVGLVEDDQVGHLDDALLDRLQVVAGIGQLQQHEACRSCRRPSFRDWPTPTVSTMMTSKPAASQSSIASRVLSATPPSEPADGDGRMKASSRCDKLLHARLVAEDGAAGNRRRRIDGEHRHAVPALDQIDAQRFDEGRFADTGHAGDADADGLAGVRQQRVRAAASRARW